MLELELFCAAVLELELDELDPVELDEELLELLEFVLLLELDAVELEELELELEELLELDTSAPGAGGSPSLFSIINTLPATLALA